MWLRDTGSTHRPMGDRLTSDLNHHSLDDCMLCDRLTPAWRKACEMMHAHRLRYDSKCWRSHYAWSKSFFAGKYSYKDDGPFRPGANLVERQPKNSYTVDRNPYPFSQNPAHHACIIRSLASSCNARRLRPEGPSMASPISNRS